MRQNEDTRGINIEGTEHKLACYADDILIYLVQPTHSLPKLMQLFEFYGQLSGYKINIGKTQLFSYNYSVPGEIQSRHPLTRQTESFKYLDINMPKDLAKLSDSNYSPVLKNIKEF